MRAEPWRSVADDFRAEHVALAISTRSKDEAIARLSGPLSPHKIRLIGASNAFAARFRAASELAGFQLSSLAFGTEVELEISTDTDHVLVTAQVEGSSEILSQGITGQGGRGFIVVDSTPDAVIKRFSADSSRINLRVPRSRLDAAWTSLTGRVLRTPLVFYPFVVDARARHRWYSHVRLLMDYGFQARVTPARLAESVTESVVLALLMEFPHNHSAQLEAPIAPAGASASRRACDFIAAQLQEPIRLEEIARHCGVSVRSLSASFAKEHGLSPMQYVTELRLKAVRAALTSRRPGVTVADAASECGFSALGRFAAIYRKRFGELPSQTLARR